MQVMANLCFDKLNLALIRFGHRMIPSSHYSSVVLHWDSSKFIVKWPFVKYKYVLFIISLQWFLFSNSPQEQLLIA